MDEQLFMRFISNILNVRVCCVETGEDILQAFETDCCFERKLQPMYTTDSLEYLIEHTQSETFYEITDYLNTNLILFKFNQLHFLVGPYVKNSFSTKEIQEVLVLQKLPASILLSIKLYYNRFPQLSYYMVAGTLNAAMRTFFPTTPEYSYRSLMGFHEEIKADEIVNESNKTYMEIIHRYEMENFFLRKITDGDVNGVNLAFDNISINFYANTDKVQKSIYSTDSTGFAVIRTLARKAAEQGGCPVVKIDEITQEAIQKSTKANSIAELEQVQKHMLLQLTKAVAEAKSLKAHSPIIRDILSYLYLNYTQNITLSEFSETYHISPEHLSRSFKKEIGKNISDYIADLRIEKATELLKNTNLTISEISMYVGYSDSNYFVKVFKRHQNMTPSEYRKSAV